MMRRRGLGNLINDLGAGDPVAWTILILVILVVVGISVFSIIRAKRQAAEDEKIKRIARKNKRKLRRREEDDD